MPEVAKEGRFGKQLTSGDMGEKKTYLLTFSKSKCLELIIQRIHTARNLFEV